MLNWRGRWGLAFLGYLVASPFFHWELRSQNCNLLFLMAVLMAASCLQRRRFSAAGGFLALSIALKLFSILVIPYLLWKRQFQAFAWTAIGMVAFWIVLPAIVFGPERFDTVYRGWLYQMAESSRNVADLAHPILISLPNAAHAVDAQNAGWIVGAVWLVWTTVAAFGAVAAWYRRDTPADAFGLLADIALLILGPISVSPYLEPYHPIVCAIPAMLLICATADSQQRSRVRLLAASLFMCGIVLSFYPAHWSARGLWVNAEMLLLAGGAALIAHLRVAIRTQSSIEAPKTQIVARKDLWMRIVNSLKSSLKRVKP